jgi:formiminotetrahydrofolate cyclodeaminase
MTSTETDRCLTSLRVEDFLTRLAGGQPTPGGGSAAALVGAMAGALACMVAHPTIGRKRYAANREEMLAVRDRASTLRNRLTTLVDEDTLAYQEVINAYLMSRSTETENNLRTAAIQQALRYATELSLEAAGACAELIELAATAACLGNRNAASDAAVAALLAQAGMRGAVLNVRANLSGLSDQVFINAAETVLSQLMQGGDLALTRAITGAGLGD